MSFENNTVTRNDIREFRTLEKNSYGESGSKYGIFLCGYLKDQYGFIKEVEFRDLPKDLIELYDKVRMKGGLGERNEGEYHKKFVK